MIIRREKRSDRFSVIKTEPIEDKNLSAVALGIYVYIMSKPDNWNAHKNEILKRFGCASIKTSKNVIDSAFSELIKAGYIVLKTIVSRTAENKVRFSGKEYLFFDTPQLSKGDNCRETEIMDDREKSKIDKTRKSKEVAHITNTDLITNINNKTNTDLISKEKSEKQVFTNTPEIKSKFEKVLYTLPADFTTELKETFEAFMLYKKQRKESYKSEHSINLLIKKIQANRVYFSDTLIIEVINLTMENNWAGIFFDKIESIKNQKKIPEKTNIDWDHFGGKVKIIGE
jgi:hypothetical protein